MSKRLLFEKTGNGIWISHLDLMRLFQRAFKRGGLHLKHTQGFSPRAVVSIALPLSVGVESVCEILDFELVGQDDLGFDEIKTRLNATMPAGIRVLEVYDSDVKIKHLTHLACTVTLEYDNGIPEGAEEAVRALFARESIVLMKRGKNGPVEQDIIPMIRSVEVSALNAQELLLDCVICAQNPSLNPAQIVAAIEANCPDHKPDFARIRRTRVLTEKGEDFR
ncbi:MAG: TIGR03936 family radical SAM-associated protein [Oscillospiraceae bacterium]|nr:TIGR03936 family radical SAM-associated protein [Oscillospiraceae bacterium]